MPQFKLGIMFIAVAFIMAALTAKPVATDRSSLIRANTEFAVDLYQRQAAQQTGNIFFSPYSISTAMAMVNVGARGATAAEIEKGMRFPFSGKRLAKAWTAVLDDVNKHKTGFDLLTANALWAARGIQFRSSYLATARGEFGARIETLDFAHAAEAARARINTWVSEATREKIRELIGQGMLGPDTLLVLTNAIYMKAKWADPFSKAATDQKGTFHAPGGDVTAPMMHKTATFPFFRGEGVRVLELPYTGRELSMLVVLPETNRGLAAIEKDLTPEKINAWQGKLAPANVSVTFPRFTSEMSLDLGETLQAMGVRRAFGMHGAPDFSGMSEKEKVAISRVIHKARIDVDEEGTEAA
ncbi:MAG TPA: serpin family protein, partial [Thermoanaerobaculia bacterium]